MRDLRREDSHLRAMGFLPGHMLKIKRRASASLAVGMGLAPICPTLMATGVLFGADHTAEGPSAHLMEPWRRAAAGGLGSRDLQRALAWWPLHRAQPARGRRGHRNVIADLGAIEVK